MKNNLRNLTRNFFLLLLLATFLTPIFSLGATQKELEAAATQKNKELDALNQQIKQVQGQLYGTQQQKQTLQSEVKKIDTTLNQLKLNLKAGEILIDKLSYEIEAAQYDIETSEKKVREKQEMIASLFRKMQQNESLNNPIVIFLKNKNLANSFFELQTITEFQGKLSDEISQLNKWKQALDQQIANYSDKKEQKGIEVDNIKYRKQIADDQKTEQANILKETQNKESIYQQQLSELKKKQEQINAEIDTLETQLKEKISPSQIPQTAAGFLSWPIKLSIGGGTGIISQHYGERSNLYGGKPHNGLDIATPVATPVFAAADGLVTANGNNGRYQYGRFILIEHSRNMTTLYGHLSKQVVLEGQRVKRGDLIGYSGNTGYSTGPHLHFGFYISSTLELKPFNGAGNIPIGVTLNPEFFL